MGCGSRMFCFGGGGCQGVEDKKNVTYMLDLSDFKEHIPVFISCEPWNNKK